MDGTPTYDLAKEFERLSADIKGGFPFLRRGLPDTDVVLLGTSLIDQYMKFVLIAGFRADAVSKRLIDAVFDGNGPLATFSAKTILCTALGLVEGEKVRHDLSTLRKIRNEFAHSYTERKIADFPQCASLQIVANLPIEDDEPLRKKFKLSCAGIIPNLALTALIRVAQGRFLANNHEAVQQEYEAMIREVYSGQPPPK